MKKAASNFSVDNCRVERTGDNIWLIIDGKKTGPPNRRFSLRGTGIKIKSANIHFRQKGKTIEHTVERINYLPTIERTRIHTAGLLYPGDYEIKLDVMSEPKKTHDWFV